jgi:DNA-directed RNA polymerase specialized sigma24 family protein
MIYEYGRECRKFRTRVNTITGYKIVTDYAYTEDAETVIVKEQTCKLLNEAVESLSPVRKQSLLASINGNKDLAKTARELGLNENTFRRNKLWALKDIRAYLQKRLSTTNLDSLR